MPEFFIIATPIGNLQDISFRALECLKRADFILCEDTRVSQKLLNYFDIKKPTISYHQHSKITKTESIIELLEQGKNIALISDAGTPGISDPGNKLVQEIITSLGENVKIIPIPGPSALATIASIAGISMDRFLFLGFPPQKKGRDGFFKQVIDSKYPVILYESPYRIIKTLKQIQELDKDIEAIVGRELTKKFETIYRGKVDKVIEKIEKDKIKGEFVVIVKRYDKRK
ncbi:MAG: 16S rRNA (cytidine(1402)-2'-O)-methyltransferase [Candidatus Parcubacteria bacterium]|nr:16S rRNA (cytidine(1402)-2'-O)-methyltransferase [Candidatus Parcubacteria bacterium]